jgi:hypothetical protein
VIVAAEEWERKTSRVGNLAEFFADSPLRGTPRFGALDYGVFGVAAQMLIVIGPLLFKISSKGDDASRHLILDQGDLACRNRRMIPGAATARLPRTR